VNEDFTLVDGSLEAALGKIDAASSVQHSYVVVPNKGSFGLRFDPATVTYVAEIDSSEKQVRFVSQQPAVHAIHSILHSELLQTHICWHVQPQHATSVTCPWVLTARSD
jgi:hypothetical protein